MENLKEKHKQELADIAYNISANMTTEEDLEQLIYYLTWWLNERKRQNEELK